ncbi:hypothetical protein PSV08DRAFT_263757, partial [Bipolaris maydis]|uniref:uncharacterized protein n=1 Tax=Cochliobolus heterostrophus TaxID=5016 RepID=UPI0024D9B615
MNYAPMDEPATELEESGGPVGSSRQEDCCSRCIRNFDCTLAGPWCIEAWVACFSIIGRCFSEALGCCGECAD